MLRGIAPFIAFAVVAAMVLNWWPYILVAAAVIVGAALAYQWAKVVRAAFELRRHQLAGIRARADQQHNAMMSGDLTRGVYGDYPPAVRP